MNLLVFVLYTALVTFVSLVPLGSSGVEHSDKLGHFITYAVFALLGYRVVQGNRTYLFICLGIIAYSGLLEVVQSFMPHRMMSAYDMLANTIGVALGAVVVKTMSARWQKKPGAT